MSIIPLVNIDKTDITFYGGGLVLISIKASIGSFVREINRFYPVEPPSKKPVDPGHPASYQKREQEAKDINQVIEDAELSAIAEMEKIFLPYREKVAEVKKQQKIEEERRRKDISGKVAARVLPPRPGVLSKPNLPYKKAVS